MSTRKGIVMAGGSGTRLGPLTEVVNKHLLPVYDKPMIYYPLCTLMQAGIREILVITTPEDQHLFQRLLGNGEQWGISISYAVQEEPRGIAEAFTIGQDFIGDDHVALILGDNFFCGEGFSETLQLVAERESVATVFAYKVTDPSQFGVVELNAVGDPISLKEKPERSESMLAVPGLYFYDNRVVAIAAGMRPSPCGEFGITDVNGAYLASGELRVHRLNNRFRWYDMGTPKPLFYATQFTHNALQAALPSKHGCPEETGRAMGYIVE